MTKTSSSVRAPYPLWRRLIKITLWTAMAAVLFVAGTLICMVSMLRPERLTPLVLRVANKELNADVAADRVELGLRATFPFLTLRVDGLTVVSRDMRALPAGLRAGLPEYADTLLTLRSLRGGINLASLAKGEIALSDIVLDGAGVNIVTAADGTANYNITPPGEDTDTTSTELPALSLTRFDIRDPRPARYYDATDAGAPDSIIVVLKPASLAAGKEPMYTLSFGGNLHMPVLGQYHLPELPFAFDGGLRWDPKDPSRLRLDNLSAAAAFLSSRFSADIEFAPVLTLRELDFVLDPVRIDTLLACLPDSMRQSMPMLKAFSSDAAIGLGVKLTQPFNTLTDSIPYADVRLDMEPCSVNLGRSRMHDVEARVTLHLRGNDPAATIVDIERLHTAGPATELTLKGTVSDIGDDPYFDGTLTGYSDLSRLPDALLNLVQGSLNGTLRADLRLCGRPSMFSRDGFHRLVARGSLQGSGLYWLSDDTTRAAFVHSASLKFGTSESLRTATGARADSLLQASIMMDSLSYLDHDISVRSTGFSLGVGASNRKMSKDTTVIMPMGGGLKMASLHVQSISDSIAVVARELGGRVMMRRYNGEARKPRFELDIAAGRMAVGSPEVRFMLTDAHIGADAHLRPLSERRKRIMHTADSLHKAHPELSLDSVYALAVIRHRRKPGARPRVHSEMTANDREIIDWGTSRGLARLLTRWELGGTITAERAGLYTPTFPLRNRVRNFNLTFNTDSIQLNNMQYKVGRSDFTVTGRITNIRRALMSKTGRQPLRMDFDMVSDTVDINQLAAATFAGAAYSQRRAAGHAAGLSEISGTDLGELPGHDEVVAAGDSASGPVLLPGNVDAEVRLRANNVLYSDLLMHNLSGSALMSNGRLNFHNLTASSDIGSIDLSALYSAPTAKDMQFGFGMVLKGFNIERFLKLVPAVDSIMPLMRDISGIIDANIAATVDIEPNMDLNLASLNAAMRLEGEQLRLLDSETYRTMAKWLMFKDKKHDVIDSMSVELLVENGMMELFPFVFNLDRYRLGVQGFNDMAMNFDYHVAVLKSPLPFKFGITVKGNPDKYKIRLGKARFNERTAISRPAIVDTTRVNLLRQIEGVFRRGVANSRIAPLKFSTRPEAQTIDLSADTITHADSLMFIREGLIPAPDEHSRTD